MATHSTAGTGPGRSGRPPADPPGDPPADGPADDQGPPPGTWTPLAAYNLDRVKVTMLLCDAAQVVGGKLYILGGGWSMTGPEPASSAVALTVDVDWHEAEIAHHWELFLEDADGQPVLLETTSGMQPVEVRGEFTVGQPGMIIPEGAPIAVNLAWNFGPLVLAPATRFSWRLTIDGESLPGSSIGFTTRPLEVTSE
jgi:hypothetical protein